MVLVLQIANIKQSHSLIDPANSLFIIVINLNRLEPEIKSKIIVHLVIQLISTH